MTSDELYLTQDHPSFFRDRRYVYPVVGRRAGGVSIGINLSQTKRCNFRCVYCQVPRERVPFDATTRNFSEEIDADVLRSELETTARDVLSGRVFSDPWFSSAPADKRSLKDFAFSGDGEPTLSPRFAQAVDIVVDVRDKLGVDSVKIVLITNATRLQSPEIADALQKLVDHNGEIWAKLDAGNDSVYRRTNRSAVEYATILDNLVYAAKKWGIVVQTMLLRDRGQNPSEADVLDYCRRLVKIRDEGGTIRRLQLYTVAREPMESDVSSLSDDEMNDFARLIHSKTSILPEIYYSK